MRRISNFGRRWGFCRFLGSGQTGTEFQGHLGQKIGKDDPRTPGQNFGLGTHVFLDWILDFLVKGPGVVFWKIGPIFPGPDDPDHGPWGPGGGISGSRRDKLQLVLRTTTASCGGHNSLAPGPFLPKSEILRSQIFGQGPTARSFRAGTGFLRVLDSKSRCLNGL